MKNKISIVMSILLLLVMFSSFVSAFAVSCQYYAERPLEISPGETKEFIFVIQNMAGEGDANVVVTIEKGSEILELVNVGIESTYDVPFGEKKEVSAKVTVPSDAEIGSAYPLQVQFLNKKESSGEFSFQSSVTKKFDVKVIEKIVPVVEEEILEEELPAETPGIPLYIYLIIALAVIVIIALVIILVKRKK